MKGGVESHKSLEILWMEVGALGSGLGESPGWCDIISLKHCGSLEGWCAAWWWSILPRGVPDGPEEGMNPRSPGVWAWEDGGP